MTNWHDEKEPAVYAPGERQRELEALSPKPPAASPDHFDIPALRLAVDAAAFMAGRGSADGLHHVMKDALREVAKEAQLRVLDAYAKDARALDGDLVWQLKSRISKEGPL